MDIERIDWWEKEKPPFSWWFHEQIKAYEQLEHERKIKFLEEWEKRISPKKT